MAPDLGGDNLASAYVTILPDLDKFTEELAAGVQAAVDSINPEVQVHADLQPFIDELAAGIEAACDALHPKVVVEADLDTSELESKAQEAADTLDAVLGHKHVEATAYLGIAPLLAELEVAKEALDDFANKIYSPTVVAKVLTAPHEDLAPIVQAVKNAQSPFQGAAPGVTEDVTLNKPNGAPGSIAASVLGALSGAEMAAAASDALSHINPNVANSAGFKMFMAKVLDNLKIASSHEGAPGTQGQGGDVEFGADINMGELAAEVTKSQKEAQAVADAHPVSEPIKANLAPLLAELAAMKAGALGSFTIPANVDFKTLPGAVQSALFKAASTAKTTTGADAVDQVVSGKNSSAISLADLMAIAHAPTHTGAMTAAGIAGMLGGGGGGGPLITSQALQDAFYGKGGPNGFVQSLLSPLTMLTSLFGAHFMSLGSMAGFGPEHLAMTGVGALGSMAGGLGGGALLGTAALSTAAVGMGTDMAGFGQAFGDIKSVSTQISALTTATNEYGASSTQAQNAQIALNNAVTSFSPVARQAVVSDALLVQQFSSMFDKYTGQAEKIAAQTIGQFIKVGEAYLPTIGHFAAENMTIIQKGLQPFLQWMTSKNGGLGVFTTLEQVFTDHLPTAVHAFTEGFELFAKTMQYLAPLTGKFIEDLDRFFTKYNTWDFGKWIKGVDKLLSLWQTWKGFFSELFKDTVALFSLTAGLGQGLAQELTGYLDELHNTLTNKGSGEDSLLTLFKVHKAEILQLVAVLVQLGSSFAKVYLVAAPALTSLTVVVLQLTNALIKLVGHIPGGDFALGLTLILAKWGVLGDLLGVGAAKAGLLSAAMRGIGKITGLQFLVDQVKSLGSAIEGTIASGAKAVASKLGGFFGMGGGTSKGVSAGEEAYNAAAASGASEEELAAIRADMEATEQKSAGLISSFKNIALAAGAMAAAVAKAVWEVLAASAKWVAEQTVMVAKTIAGWAAEAAAAVADAAVEVASFVAVAAAAVAAFVAENAATLGIIAGIAVLVAGIIYLATHWKQVWSDIKQWTADAVNFIKSHMALALIFAPGIAELVLFAEHWHQIWNGVKTVFTDVVNFIRSHVLMIGAALALLFPEFALPIAAIAILVTHWRDAWTLIATITHTAIAVVVDALHLVVDAFKLAFDPLAAIVKITFDLIKGYISAVMDVIVGIIKVALDLLTGNWGAAWRALKTMVDQVWGDIKGTIGGILNTLKGLGEQIINIFKDAGHWLLDAGKNIVEGLINGIKDAAHLVKGVAGDVAHDVVGAFKSGFGIFSPSKVTTDIGTNVSAGLANGITQGGKQAIDAAAKLADEVSKQFGSLKAPAADAKAIAGLQTFFKNLSGMFTNLNSAVSGASKIKAGDITQVTSALDFLSTQGVGSISKAIDKLESAFGNIKKKSQDSLKDITGTFGAISKLFNAIQTTVRTTKGVANLQEVIVGLDTVLFWSRRFLVTAIDEIEGAFAPLVGKTNHAVQKITDFFGALSKLFNAVGTTVRSSAHTANMQAIVTALNAIRFWGQLTIVPTIINVEAVFDALTKSTGKALQKITGFFGSLSKMFNAVGTTSRASFNTMGLQNVGHALEGLEIWGAMKVAQALKVIDQVYSKDKDASDKALGHVSDLFTSIGKMFSAVGQAVNTAGKVTGLTQVVSGLDLMVTDAKPLDLLLFFVNTSFSKYANLATSATQTIQKFFREIVKLFDAVQSAGKGSNSISDVIDSLKTLTSQAAPVQAALTNVQNALNGVTTALSGLEKNTTTDTKGVVTAIQNMASQVMSALNGLVTGAKNIGTNLTQGLVNGINSGSGAVAQAAATAASNAAKAANAAVGNQSPSKVFHLIGTNMMQGMANGITQGFQTHVTPALTAAAKGITDNFKPTLKIPTVAVGSGTLVGVTPRGTSINTSPDFGGLNGGVGSTVIHSTPQYNVTVQGNADPQNVALIKKMLAQHDNDLLQKIGAPMSIQTITLAADGTFTYPSNIISANITVTVTGARGNSSSAGLTPGAVISGQFAASLLLTTSLSVIIGHDATVYTGGDGFSGGGGGGGWQYGVAPPFFGGGGGGSTAVIDATTSALYMEAGGGDGGSYSYGALGANPSLFPGGSGGGYSANSPDSGLNVGEGAGTGGAAGGHGGHGTIYGGSSSGGTGNGGGTNGNDASGQTSGAAVGSGGLAVLGAGACYADTSNVANATYGLSGAVATVVFSYHAADAPSAPVLTSPSPGQYLDANGEGVTFTATYQAPSGDTGVLAAVALSIDGGAHWWDGTDFSSTVQIWNSPSSEAGAASGQSFTLVVPPGVITDSGVGSPYSWTMATRESYYGLDGPTAAPQTFYAVIPPTAVVSSPTGFVNDLTPTVEWTPTIPYSGTQQSYRFVIYYTAQEMTYNAPPPVGYIYDSGVVATPGDPSGTPVSFTMPSGYLHSIFNYVGYLQIVNSVGGVPSLWITVPFTIELLSGDTVTLTAVPSYEPATGIPAPLLTMTIDNSDLDSAEFQADYIGDETWLDCIAGIQTIVSETCFIYDLGCPFNKPLQYRVRGVGTTAGEQYVTAWSDAVPVPDIASKRWAIVSPANPTGSMLLHRLPSSGTSTSDEVASPTTPAMPGSMVASFISDEWEQQGVFHPFGKSTATVVHGDLWQPEFTIDLFFLSPAEWATFRAVRLLQEVVLLKSDMEGTTYWVTLGPDLNPGIMSEAERQADPKRGLTVSCTPTDPYIPPNPYIPVL